MSDPIPHWSKAYIDADSMIHAAGHVCKDEPAHHAFQICKKWIEGVPATERVVVIGNEDKTVNNRHEVSTLAVYKGNRKAPKPKHYKAIREYLIKHQNAVVVPRQEADDYVCAMSYQDNKKGEHTVISGIDKDLMNTPGDHYNWKTGVYTKIEHHEGAKKFYIQMLMGDSTDNIKGLPEIATRIKHTIPDTRGLRKQCGAKAAEKILSGYDTEIHCFLRVMGCYSQYIRETFWHETSAGTFDYDDLNNMTEILFMEMAGLLWVEQEWEVGYQYPCAIEFNSGGWVSKVVEEPAIVAGASALRPLRTTDIHEVMHTVLGTTR